MHLSIYLSVYQRRALVTTGFTTGFTTDFTTADCYLLVLDELAVAVVYEHHDVRALLLDEGDGCADLVDWYRGAPLIPA